MSLSKTIKMLRLAVASAFSSLLAVVNAHGGAMHYIIDGEVYTGYVIQAH